ncbi:hypothetical protein C6P46_005474 [Rhodotorula mucilaginosa]|uniref:Uncharacterized protein n=1 Tax=Rhodotorula mucilaginosa TaxID=5537 RepID=A0A9P6W961_RHOMI|nr:hypothetical protein C6P46_005474 [Rhodotorula mucilaginosa]
MELEDSMLVSMLLGFLASSAAIAAFIPLVLINASKRRSGTGPGFLACWLVADALNLAGIILLGAPVTQKILAAWYALIDFIMLVQLIMFGHDDLSSRPPQRTSNFLKICERDKKPRYAAMMRHFGQFSTWDCVKLLAFCLLGGATACGWYLTLGLRNDPHGFEIEIPRGFDEKSFFMGLSACLIFAAARLPECYSGWARSHRGQEPIHSLSDPLFYFLIIENVFYLASILTLSRDPDYLIAESPFIAGAVIPITFDLLMLASMVIWHRRWRRLDTPYARRLRMQLFSRTNEESKMNDERTRVERLREMDDIEFEAFQPTEIFPPTTSRSVKRRLKARNKRIIAARSDLDANRLAFEALRGPDLDKTYTYSVTEL